ncbi:MAG: hypothetical protein CMN30_04695 [Sandaracinus sp.]|nr:hypothetical protein [Sandaracinus sp.]
MTRFERDTRRIMKRLGTIELMAQSMDDVFVPDDLGLSGDVEARRGPRRFLDFYGDEGLRLAFRRYGLEAALEERGYEGIELDTDADDERHVLRVSGAHPDLPRRELLIELVVRRDRLVPGPDAPIARPHEVLTLDWLTMRDPARGFSAERPALPGQDAPGLGVGERVLEVLYRVTERLELDGLVGVADHFHNAVIYRRELTFLEIGPAARHLALEDALFQREELTLSQAAWAMEWGLVRDGAGDVIRHRPAAQVRSFTEDLTRVLRDEARRREVLQRATAIQVALDREAFERRWAERPPDA